MDVYRVCALYLHYVTIIKHPRRTSNIQPLLSDTGGLSEGFGRKGSEQKNKPLYEHGYLRTSICDGNPIYSCI